MCGLYQKAWPCRGIARERALSGRGATCCDRTLHAKYPRRPRRVALWAARSDATGRVRFENSQTSRLTKRHAVW